MPLVAKAPYAYVYADNNGTHKQGKVFPDQALLVSDEKGNGYWLKKPTLDRELDPRYMDKFWVFKTDVEHVYAPAPAPEPELADVAQAVIVILKWIRSL